MRTFVWLVTIALGVLCYALWIVGELVTSYVRDFRQVVPVALAELVLHHTWLLFCPLPWIVYAALLSRRRELSPGAVFVFAGTICLVMIVIVSIVALGAILACVPFKL